MLKNKDLHTYFCNKAEVLTEQWHDSLNMNQSGVYGSTNPVDIQKLKSQNTDFHLLFCKIFDPDEDYCIEDFQGWIKSIAEDEAHQKTPLEEIIKGFFRTQKQYTKLIEEYVLQLPEEITSQQVLSWSQGVVEFINQIILEFTIQHSKAIENRLNAQQEMIIEMSAPVISLTIGVGVLPLVGEITIYRAQVIFEKVLIQCAEQKIEQLFIDLSGVPIIDTIVAHQIFQVIRGLKIIGVETALSGISPPIAQNAIQLGVSFNNIKVYNTLAQAMKVKEINIM